MTPSEIIQHLKSGRAPAIHVINRDLKDAAKQAIMRDVQQQVAKDSRAHSVALVVIPLRS